MTRALVPTRLHRLLRSGQSFKPVGKTYFSSSARLPAAQELTMPAMSPTMTEGNIASWKVKEGDSFAVGDVLLEIETDKAQMDVEAQDDGVLAKIMQPAGSKGVSVGTRIAVTADAGDDLKTLDMSALQTQKQQSSSNSGDKQTPAGESKLEESTTPSKPIKADTADRSSSEQSHRNAKYPLFPSVVQLLHERGLSQDEAAKISASGPNGRLLKGDVLAYLGEITSSYPQDSASRISKLGHLDLSNIELATPAKSSDIPVATDMTLEEPQATSSTSEVMLPISLAAVQSVRQRVKRVLGVDVALETFIARATQLCNNNLPRSRTSSLTADELFEAVLGIDVVSVESDRPLLVPQVQALMAEAVSPSSSRASTLDIIDELTVGSEIPSHKAPRLHKPANQDPSLSLFSVSVPSGDEGRARVFLERLKTTLQVEPGKLVL